jgi:hypothetical protein
VTAEAVAAEEPPKEVAAPEDAAPKEGEGS